jgi:hypothetical protein
MRHLAVYGVLSVLMLTTVAEAKMGGWTDTGPGTVVFKSGTTTGFCTRIRVRNPDWSRYMVVTCEQPWGIGEYRLKDVSAVVRPAGVSTDTYLEEILQNLSGR